ncbi:3-hydroxyacyl-CoA dehydrogenase/enoyl-CoA hydratase family protein [Halalkalicoccus sp. NIPERK01]|uniref:3-hydroxyacyl-CoA dehydrogenase/enoyl-CoA hydratase family protein n=1 Tax=Halalkalicoccus sp. NIPERK01 TaxID=3053469 RepID=UPI00256F1712|nr:3-hydroxyacyl-CoA dehydrogenase/enoyl-CoA hydratase family protein [Halalkalicoccus sp. NIPERK01]MDL5361248.1 3-hydroxyacyl-CoA dehydrogenase NAD-binding domain-containing protein [Halalkalicoccus sp. NIPERK01]
MELDDVNTITVLGAGNMGHGIAEVAAIAGYDVYMRDIKEEFVRNGYEQIEWSLGKLAEQDRLTEEEADAALDRVTPVVDVEEAVSGTDFLIEAVPEQMEIKKDVYTEVERYAPEGAVFATNTSSLSITELSEVTDRPERFCGMHFFNPPVRMPLVEVISGAHTDEGTLELTESLAEDFDKTPVRVHKDSPGFIVNRILVPLMNEAAWLVSEGEATITEVDSTTKFDIGHPMGAFELGDQVGNDVSYHVLEYMHEVLGDAYEPAPLLAEKVENEELGKKTGKGFYDYEDGPGAEIPADEGSEFVERRLLASMANEVAKLIGGDVAPPESIDEAVTLGGGWPDGPVTVVDEYGIETLLETLETAHEETGHERYRPDEYLRERAEAGGFYDADDDEAESDGYEYDAIAVEVDGRVGHLAIDRPHRMNTITTGMIEEIDDALDRLVDDDDVRAVLLTGSGDRAFSAGFDASTAAAGSGLETAELARRGQHVFGRFEEVPMPVIAAIDGYCLGGGMELSACADMRLATERSRFGQPEHDLGLMPGWGGTQRLPRIVGEGRAKEIIFTARNDYDPETMADYGFVNEVVSPDGFEDRAWELARDLAAGPPIAQRFTKRAMLAGRDDIDAGLEFEASAFGHLFTTDDLWEGLSAFQSDRDPEFEGK